MDFDRIMAVVSAARAWHDRLIELEIYGLGEAVDHSPLRSDRWPPEVDLMAAVDKLVQSPVAMLPGIVESRFMHDDGQVSYMGCAKTDDGRFRLVTVNPMTKTDTEQVWAREEATRLFEVLGTALQVWGPLSDLTPLPSPVTLGAAAEQAPQTQGEVSDDQHTRGRHAAAD